MFDELNTYSASKNDREDKTTKRIEDLEEREQRERYKDIVNVHVAALNASHLDDSRPYKSVDGDEAAYEDQLLI